MTQTDGAGAAPAPAMTLAEAAALYRPALDFPKPGIRFWSGHEMTAHPRAFRCMLDAMETRCRAWSARTQRPIDHVAGFDARGFILGAPMEYAFGQTVAMAGNDPLSFLFTERLGMVFVLVATPIIAGLLWRRMQSVPG